MAVRAWNLVVLAALAEKTNRPARILLDYFQPFSQAYSASLSAYQYSEYASQDVAHVDISRAYASIKLWLLLSQKAAMVSEDDTINAQIQRDEGDCSKMVWNDLWPPFESVVVAVETDAQNGLISVRLLPILLRI